MNPVTVALVRKLIGAIADLDFSEETEPVERQAAELIGFAGAVQVALDLDEEDDKPAPGYDPAHNCGDEPCRHYETWADAQL